jgi:aerobic-type carbon monoxide dehydrogenase small subunit (CoxS/CutS family)
MATELQINGRPVRLEIDAERSLLSVLRDEVGLVGAKYGCGEGRCGACTVLVNGLPRHACTTMAVAVAGKEITTIEGLARDGKLHPLQAAFLDTDAMQCGYCTPGMILTAAALLRANPNPSREEIVRHMNGNICRCGTYQRIIAAIGQAASAMKAKGGP